VRAADTYFSLGLEFDNGRRLEADSRLIESDPLIFSGFHNLPCAGLSLEELEGIALWFPFIVNLYPKSFLLLSLAVRESISCLFSRFLKKVRECDGKSSPALSPADCRLHLPAFAEQALSEGGVSSWSHLPEVIVYESLAMDAGDSLRGAVTGNADLCMLNEWRPHRNRSAVVREFRHNLPEIIADLKEGIFSECYDEAPTIVVFMPKENGLDVSEINEFGRDLLELSDGSSSMEEIAQELFRRFGSGMDSARFRDECREAVAVLAAMDLLQRADSAPPRRKEVISC
jgi:hypothetical protein